MNSLSWLLYWADVLPSVSNWLCCLSFLLFCATLFVGIAGFTNMFGDASKVTCEYIPSTNSYEAVETKNTELMKLAVRCRRAGLLSILFFILWGGSFLVPEKETFYLIAGSEAGERALQTPEFGKVRAVINKYLDDQLPDEPEKKTEDSK